MRVQLSVWLLATCVVAAACGDTKEPASAPSQPERPAAAAPALIGEDALTRCAGFNTDKAAAIFGAAPSAFTDHSRAEGGLRLCLYRKNDEPRKAVSFSLSRRDSVETAAESIQNERETMGSAQAAIDQVTGSASKKPAVEDVSAIGDDAFYSSLNGAIMFRVKNVIVQVTAPGDMALKKRAAEEVARGLQP